MITLRQDIRHSIRTLIRERGFTAVALGALALGIGATTAIFSVVDAVLLRPLPYDEPNDLVVVWERNTARSLARMSVAAPNYADWRERNRAFADMGAFVPGSFFVGLGGEPIRMHGARVTASLFPVLGVAPALGRAFSAGDEGPEAMPVVIISDRLWRGWFGADPDVVGGTLEIDETLHTIIGVMRPGFDFLPPVEHEESAPGSREGDLWVPFNREMAAGSRTARNLTVVARLRPGLDLAAARAEMEGVARQLQGEYPEANAGWDVTLVPLAKQLTVDVRPQLLVLLGAVGLLLLIACVNVANLMLARGTVRRRELAVRAALGASHGRLVQFTLSESLALGLVGGALGVLLAIGVLDVLVRLAPVDVPRLDEAGIDVRVLGFAALISVLTSILFGLAPALQAFGTDLAGRLREGGRSGGEGVAAPRLRSALVVAEIALALVLLVGGSLLFQSLLRLRGAETGFRAAGVVSMRITLPASRYPDATRRAAAFEELERRLRTMTGVEEAGFVFDVPLTADRQGTGFTIEGEPPPPEGFFTANFTVVTPGYFQAMDIPLSQGRGFRPSDRAGAEPVVIINEALARRHFGAEDPVGRRLLRGGDLALRIIGVAGSVRHTQIRAEPTPAFYFPFAQAPWYRSMSLVARGDVPIDALLATTRAAVRDFDSAIPVYDVKTIEQILAESVAELRFSGLLLGVFSVAAALLAALGIYGVIGYTVNHKRQETGIRMVLGARQADILRLVLGQALKLAGLGVVIGAGAALALGRTLASLVYGIAPSDPLTLAVTGVSFLALATLACWIPARRAARLDPAAVLKAE